MRLVRSASLLAGALALALVGCSGSKARPNVVLIVVDSLRADALGCYGSPLGSSPHLDALAAGGMRYERAIAQAPWNLPSVSSLLTGVYPSHHAMDAGPGQTATLAEAFGKAGYHTAAFVEATWPLLERGFTTVRNTTPDDLYGSPEDNSAHTTLTAAVDWLGKQGASPSFVLIHTYQVHSYFLGKASQHAAAHKALPDYDGPFRNWKVRDTAGGAGTQVMDALLHASPEDLAYVRALYQAAVSETDAAVGELVKALHDHGLDERTVLVVTSSNGEGFRPDLKRVHHGGRLHDDLLHVPLIIRWPGRIAAGTDRDLVELIDVAPTLVHLAGLTAEPLFAGRALFDTETGLWAKVRGPRFLSAPAKEQVAVAEESALRVTPTGQRETTTLRQAALYSGWLALIDGGDHVELYDLKADPREEKNLCAGFGGAEALEQARKAAGASQEDDTTAGLKSLGYLEGAVAQTDESLCGPHSDAVRALYAQLRGRLGEVDASQGASSGDVTNQLRSLGYVQ
jgi:arylsulfatase A-like enzyme